MYSIRSQTSLNTSASWITSPSPVKQIHRVWVLRLSFRRAKGHTSSVNVYGFFLSTSQRAFKSFQPAELIYLLSDSHPKGSVVKKGAPGHNGKRYQLLNRRGFVSSCRKVSHQGLQSCFCCFSSESWYLDGEIAPLLAPQDLTIWSSVFIAVSTDLFHQTSLV